jgi:hypothetical protein
LCVFVDGCCANTTQGLLAWADVVDVYEQYKQQVIGLDDAVTATQQLLDSHASTTVQQVRVCMYCSVQL